MLVEKNCLYRIDPEDIVDGVFISPDDVLYITDLFRCDLHIEKMILPKVQIIGNSFLEYDFNLKHIDMPSVVEIRNRFLNRNNNLEFINAPNLISIGDNFLFCNDVLTKVEFPKLEMISDNVFHQNTTLVDINIPNIKYIGYWFAIRNWKIKYTGKMLKALSGDLIIDSKVVDVKDYVRKRNIARIIH